MTCALTTGLSRFVTVLRPRKAATAQDIEATDDIVAQHALSYGKAPELISVESQVEIARLKSLRRTLP